MTLRQRNPRHRDSKHLAFVRLSGCVVCPKGVSRPIEAAHIRMGCQAIGKRETGLAEKPGDQWTVGLCDYHHRTGRWSQHNQGERDFWIMHGRNPFEIATRLWIQSGGSERAVQPKPAKRAKKIAARKPRHLRVKVPQGRKLQSRGFERRP